VQDWHFDSHFRQVGFPLDQFDFPPGQACLPRRPSFVSKSVRFVINMSNFPTNQLVVSSSACEFESDEFELAALQLKCVLSCFESVDEDEWRDLGYPNFHGT
jgi:hypothetical protein